MTAILLQPEYVRASGSTRPSELVISSNTLRISRKSFLSSAQVLTSTVYSRQYYPNETEE